MLSGDHTPNLPGWPYIVLEDTDSRAALYMPEGTRLWRWDIADQRFREPRTTQGDSVRLFFPGKPYSVDCFYETGSGPAPWVRYLFLGDAPPFYPASRLPPAWSGPPPAGTRFYGWKVDIVAPPIRTELGFDFSDEVLDIVVRPDRTYVWKDEDQMAQCVALGIYSQAEADRLHAAGSEVIDLIEQSKSPFDSEWPHWTPPSDLRCIPEAPQGWHLLPLADSEWGNLHRRIHSSAS
jgi:hypothetical protein